MGRWLVIRLYTGRICDNLANDIQDCCVDTYAHNHPETPRDHIVLGDIKDVVKILMSYWQAGTLILLLVDHHVRDLVWLTDRG